MLMYRKYLVTKQLEFNSKERTQHPITSSSSESYLYCLFLTLRTNDFNSTLGTNN